MQSRTLSILVLSARSVLVAALLGNKWKGRKLPQGKYVARYTGTRTGYEIRAMFPYMFPTECQLHGQEFKHIQNTHPATEETRQFRHFPALAAYNLAPLTAQTLALETLQSKAGVPQLNSGKPILYGN